MAAVSESSSSNRFFCHQCNVEIPRVLPDFKCPTCNSGFIEEMEAQPRYSFSDESSDEGEAEMVTFGGLLAQNFLSSLLDNSSPTSPTEEATGSEVSSARPGSSSGAGTRRRRPEGSFRSPIRAIRRRTSSADNRQQNPLENLIQEIFIDFSGGVGFDPAMLQAQGSRMFMYGNPGDYAFGNGGLDAIITQILNQMDGTGPPPMARDKIAEIPTVKIQQSEVDKNMQCSVCWDDFKLDEPVRKLVCEHLYHEQCIVPWLQLHGTCPICRKSLNDESEPESGTSTSAGPSNLDRNPNTNPTTETSTASNNGTFWLPSPSSTGFLSSVIGTITNALSGVSSPLRSQQAPSTSSSSSQQTENDTTNSQPSTSVRHPYHLRNRERPSGQEAPDSNEISRPTSGSNHRSRTQDQSRYNFEDDYD